MNANQLVDLLKKKNAFVCTVESCTGGLLANDLTDISGSSEVVWGGWVTYDNSAKEDLVDVGSELILAHGAVSREVALAMAEGGLKKLSRSLNDPTLNRKHPATLLVSVALTGIAGPTGGTPVKPVGLCYIGLSVSGRDSAGPTRFQEVIEVRAPAGQSRTANKRTFANAAIELIAKALSR